MSLNIVCIGLREAGCGVTYQGGKCSYLKTLQGMQQSESTLQGVGQWFQGSQMRSGLPGGHCVLQQCSTMVQRHLNVMQE